MADEFSDDDEGRPGDGTLARSDSAAAQPRPKPKRPAKQIKKEADMEENVMGANNNSGGNQGNSRDDNLDLDARIRAILAEKDRHMDFETFFNSTGKDPGKLFRSGHFRRSHLRMDDRPASVAIKDRVTRFCETTTAHGFAPLAKCEIENG